MLRTTQEGEIEAGPGDYKCQTGKYKEDYMALQHRRFEHLTPNKKLRN